MFTEPVVGEKFFGRAEVLELLHKRVRALHDGYRQNVALTGQSLAGKTSILHHFLYHIQSEPFITTYIEVINEPFDTFANRFIATLLYHTLIKIGEPVTTELDDILTRTRETLPKTYVAVKHIGAYIERDQREEAYLNLLNLTSVVKEEVHLSCIVILDEFDNLECLGIKNPFLNFGKVLMVQKDTMYIVSSSRYEAIRKIISEKLSLLFGNFEVVRVGGFDVATANAFLDARADGFEIDAPLRKFMIEFTAGNAFYLSHVIRHARDHALERMSSHIDLEAVEEAILDLVYDAHGAIHQYLLTFLFDILDTKHRDAALTVLSAIADGQRTQPEIYRHTRIPRTELVKLLARLVTVGLLAKQGVFYTIEDTMLAFWLSAVYQRRKKILVDGIIDRRSLLKEGLDAFIRHSLAAFSQEPIDRITDLFGTFGNEMIAIDGRTFRLPHFTKIETGQFASGRRFLRASLRGSVWLVQPFEHAVNEFGITELVRNLKSLDTKIAHKVIVPLEGIDENARLLAKELRMIIWETPTVNMLLRLYGKHQIMSL